MVNDTMRKIIKDSINNKVSQGKLVDPPYEVFHDKLEKRNLKAERLFLHKSCTNIPYYIQTHKAFLASVCLIMFSLILFEPSRAFAENILKKIYVVYKDNGAFKLKQVEIKDDIPKEPIQVPDVTGLNDKEVSDRVGFKVITPSELSDDYLIHSKVILKAVDKDGEEKDSVSVSYTKLNVTTNEIEMVSLRISDLKWPLGDSQFTENGIEFYYNEAGVAEYQVKVDEQGNTDYDLEKKPEGIDLIHQLAWRIDNVTYILSDVGGRDLTKEQLLEIAKPLLDQLLSK